MYYVTVLSKSANDILFSHLLATGNNLDTLELLAKTHLKQNSKVIAVMIYDDSIGYTKTFSRNN